MLNEEQRRHIRVRHELDRMEAVSEQARDEGAGYSMQFSEGAREELERMADYFSQPVETIFADFERKEAVRFARLLEAFERLQQADVQELELVAFTNFFPPDPEHHLTVYLIEPDGNIHTMMQLVSDGRWPAEIEKLEATPDVEGFAVRLSKLQELAENTVTTHWVTVPATKLSAELVEYGTRAYLKRYYPDFAELSINWLPETEHAEFAKALMAQSFSKRVAERPQILDALIQKLTGDDSDLDQTNS